MGSDGHVRACIGTFVCRDTEIHREKQRMGSDGHTQNWKTQLQNEIKTTTELVVVKYINKTKTHTPKESIPESCRASA